MMMKVERSRDDDDASGDRLRSIGDKDDAVHCNIGDDVIFPMMLLLFYLSISAGVEIY